LSAKKVGSSTALAIASEFDNERYQFSTSANGFDYCCTGVAAEPLTVALATNALDRDLIATVEQAEYCWFYLPPLKVTRHV
jgi:hypothetical protein